MRVLVTGGLGSIGREVTGLLLKVGHEVRCLDMDSQATRRALSAAVRAPWWSRRFEIIWGDVRRGEDVRQAVAGVDAVVHLAAIIPPLSERKPELSREVNVGGTRLLIEAARRLNPKPKFVFSSSVSVYGPRMADPPPRRADEALNPTDHYTHHKVECEEMLGRSDLPWTVLRIAAVLSTDVLGRFDPLIFEIPLEQRIELVHAEDVARACVNALTPVTDGKVLLIGGGSACQMLHRDFLKGITETSGLGMFPVSAFRVPREPREWFYTDFLDSEEAQRLLHFQVHTFADYLRQLRVKLGWRFFLARADRPLARRVLLRSSPYFGKGRRTG